MNNITTTKGEIVMYQPDETIRLEVRVEDETVWLNRQQIADLFSRDVKTVAKHINNALKEELKGEPVGAKFATTASDGKDIKCAGKEQALRYAVILLDIADEAREDFDELIIEVRGSRLWVHFAVRPKGNRRKILFDVK